MSGLSLERRRTPVDGIGIAWLTSAPSAPARLPPVIVLHGLGSSSREFEDLAREPGLGHRRLILVDLPGFGASDRPGAWSYAMEAQADLVAALLRQVAASPVALVGHSMGGSIAIAIAFRHPGLVERLIVAEPILDPGTGTLSGHIARQPEAVFIARGYQRLVYQTRREAARGDRVAARFLVTLEQASPVALHRCATSLRADRSPTFRAQLEALAFPRTLIWGARTPPLTPPLVDPAIAVERIPDAGHVMMTEQPAAFAAAILAAIDDNDVAHHR